MSITKTSRVYIKNLDQAPRKVAIVASLIRNRTIDDALVILEHVPRRASLAITKAVNSLKSNANNLDLDESNLIISKISVTTGRRLKRQRAASKGRALPYQKKSSNILIETAGNVKVKSNKTTTKTTTKTVSSNDKTSSKSQPKVKKEEK